MVASARAMDKLQILERYSAQQLAGKGKHIKTLQEQMQQLKEIGATPNHETC